MEVRTELGSVNGPLSHRLYYGVYKIAQMLEPKLGRQVGKQRL